MQCESAPYTDVNVGNWADGKVMHTRIANSFGLRGA